MVDLFLGLSQVVLMGKNPPASVGDIRDSGSIPGEEHRKEKLSPGGIFKMFLLMFP